MYPQTYLDPNLATDICNKDASRLLHQFNTRRFTDGRLRSLKICLTGKREDFPKIYAKTVRAAFDAIRSCYKDPVMVAVKFVVLQDADENIWGDYGQFLFAFNHNGKIEGSYPLPDGRTK